MVSEEEVHRTVEWGGYYIILPVFPELRCVDEAGAILSKEYSSADNLATAGEIEELLKKHRLMVESGPVFDEGV